MPKRDLLDLSALSYEEIAALIDRAASYKQGAADRPLAGKSLGLLFEKSSTRTRVSFEVATWRLGGLPIFLSSEDMQIKRGETIADSARVLSSYLDALIVRTHGQEKLEHWAKYASIPIINGLTDLHHPCQILSDFFSIQQCRGKLQGLKLVYIGDGNNMANSLLEGGALVGMNITIAAPPSRLPDAAIFEQAKKQAEKWGTEMRIEHDPMKAAEGADILYTDVWVSMGDEAGRDELLKVLKPYQINDALLKKARPECLVMHCLPAHRGEEITTAVMEGPNAIIFEQAANRLPMQQAILEHYLKP